MWSALLSLFQPHSLSIQLTQPLVCTPTQGKQGDAGSAGSRSPAAVVPPPPPTVAPKNVAPERTPRVKQAYRKPKKSEQERQQEQQQAQTEQAAARAGHEQYLSQEALAAKAAALQQTSQSADKWRHHVIQPLINIAPEHLRRRLTNSSSSSSSRKLGGGAQHRQTATAAGGTVVPSLLVVDALNLLHAHKSTKQLIEQDHMDLAQQHMHKLLARYAQEQHTHVLLVYEAYNVPRLQPRRSSSSRGGFTSSSSSSSSSQPSQPSSQHQEVSSISTRVNKLREAGKSADTFIIDLIRELVSREARAAAQGFLGISGPTLCNITVHTNDNAIRDDVTAAAMAGEQLKQVQNVVGVGVLSSTLLSDKLRLVENKLHSEEQRQRQQQWRGPAAALPDPQQDTVAWAQAFLARSGMHSSPGSSSRSGSDSSGSDSDQEEQNEGSSSSNGERRRRRETTQQRQARRQAAAEAALLAAGVTDEQLLALSGAGQPVAAAAAAAAACSGSAAAEDDSGTGTHHAAAAGEGPQAQSLAHAGGGGGVVQSPSSSTSKQLDDLLSFDIEGLLPDI